MSQAHRHWVKRPRAVHTFVFGSTIAKAHQYHIRSEQGEGCSLGQSGCDAALEDSRSLTMKDVRVEPYDRSGLRIGSRKGECKTEYRAGVWT